MGVSIVLFFPKFKFGIFPLVIWDKTAVNTTVRVRYRSRHHNKMNAHYKFILYGTKVLKSRNLAII